MGSAERQRRYRERKGADVGGPPGPKPSASCGTYAAARRHQRHGEPLCGPCAIALRERQAQNYKKRKS